MIVLKEYVAKINIVSQASPNTKTSINLLIEDIISEPEEQPNLELLQQQLNKLFLILNTPSKMAILTDASHRELISVFIKLGGIEHYKYSYYNRAKLTQMHIQKLLEVGPILFSEAVMIASKLNTINKNSSRIYTEDNLYSKSENPIDLKIQEILKLCDCKKRAVNNNFRKLELILDGHDCLEIIKELGKMLRDSWKKDKSKVKCIDVVINSEYKEIAKIYNNEVEILRVPNKKKCKDYEEISYEDIYSWTSSQNEIINQSAAIEKILSSNVNFLNDEGFCSQESKDYFEKILNQGNL